MNSASKRERLVQSKHKKGLWIWARMRQKGKHRVLKGLPHIVRQPLQNVRGCRIGWTFLYVSRIINKKKR